MNRLVHDSPQWSNARRSQRVRAVVALRVRWLPPGEQPLAEDTNSIDVNAHGGLVTLMMRVKPGNKVFLRRMGTEQENECRVVHVKELPGGKKEVGLAFGQADPGFWGLEQIPDDWKFYLRVAVPTRL